jgi:hypothetical protein
MGYGVAGRKWFFLLTTVPHYLIVKIYISHFKNDVTSPCSAFFSNGNICFRPEVDLFSNFGVKHSYGAIKDVTSRRDHQCGA